MTIQKIQLMLQNWKNCLLTKMRHCLELIAVEQIVMCVDQIHSKDDFEGPLTPPSVCDGPKSRKGDSTIPKLIIYGSNSEFNIKLATDRQIF